MNVSLLVTLTVLYVLGDHFEGLHRPKMLRLIFLSFWKHHHSKPWNFPLVILALALVLTGGSAALTHQAQPSTTFYIVILFFVELMLFLLTAILFFSPHPHVLERHTFFGGQRKDLSDDFASKQHELREVLILLRKELRYIT